jgi:uncharacterized protein (TIGR02145 family)
MNKNSQIFILTFASTLLISLSACSFEEPEPEFVLGSVTDTEGNIYRTVKIGNQEWMAENLFSQTFRDGTDIHFIGADTLSWMNYNAPAYTWYHANVDNRNAYGALYNWYAVNHASGLCPDGWRIMNRHDWDKLLNYLMKRHRRSNDLNDRNAVGKMLKSCRQVNSPHGEECNTTQHPRWNPNDIHFGTNDYQFSALPGGLRRSTGGFYGRGGFGLWWTTNTSHTDSATVVYFNFDYNKAFGNNRHKRTGLSVRCMKDI